MFFSTKQNRYFFLRAQKKATGEEETKPAARHTETTKTGPRRFTFNVEREKGRFGPNVNEG